MISSEGERLVNEAFMGAIPSSTGWYRAHCPFCEIKIGKRDKRRSLGILVTDWVYHCFRCKSAGKLSTIPSYTGNITIPDGDEVYDLGPPDGFSSITDDSMLARPARKYLLKRSVTQDLWEDLGIGYTLEGRAAFRVVVPVFASDQETWLGWVGRAWTKDPELKYTYPVGMKRGGLLFNSVALSVNSSDPLLVVEGVFDALPHYPNAVACLGKPTRDQVAMLLSTERNLVIALDGDAWREGEALCMRLCMEGKTAGWIKFPPLSDPGDFSKKQLSEMAQQALS